MCNSTSNKVNPVFLSSQGDKEKVANIRNYK